MSYDVLDRALELPDMSEEFLRAVKPQLERYFDDAAHLAEKLVKDVLNKTGPVPMENNKLPNQLLVAGRALGTALGYTIQHITDYCGIQLGDLKLGQADNKTAAAMRRMFAIAIVRSLIRYCMTNQLLGMKEAKELVDLFDAACGAGKSFH